MRKRYSRGYIALKDRPKPEPIELRLLRSLTNTTITMKDCKFCLTRIGDEVKFEMGGEPPDMVAGLATVLMGNPAALSVTLSAVMVWMQENKIRPDSLQPLMDDINTRFPKTSNE